MNRYEFLNELRKELRFLPPEELEDAVNYYNEYICDSEDEQRAIEELGSPKRAAEDIKREYYSKPPLSPMLPANRSGESGENGENSRRPIWFYVLLVVVAVGFGVPLLNLLGSAASSVAYLIVLAVIALLLFKALKRKDNPSDAREAEVQTCSDIRSLDIRLGAGMFVIEQGDSFKINGANIKSFISGGVWHISANITDNISQSNPRVITITLPDYFTAEKSFIKLGAGNLLIKSLSAYEMRLAVSVGNLEAERLLAENLDLKCGVGRMKAAASLHGDVSVNCGMGETTLTLTNRADEFNSTVSVGLGKVFVAGQETDGNRTYSSASAPYNINIKCGMGNVRVDFGGQT